MPAPAAAADIATLEAPCSSDDGKDVAEGYCSFPSGLAALTAEDVLSLEVVLPVPPLCPLDICVTCCSCTSTVAPAEAAASAAAATAATLAATTTCNGCCSPDAASQHLYHCHHHRSMSASPASNNGDTLQTVRIKPDCAGRFGFNVKGGADQGTPILVTKVAPNSPADLSVPRLREGDRLLYINGRDLSSHTHEQAVQFIRAAAERHSGELLMVVSQQSNQQQHYDPASGGDDFAVVAPPCEEAEKEYDDSQDQEETDEHAESQEESMSRLQTELEDGSALGRFERLYRRKPGLSMCAAKHPENVAKNRYRDISPYDSTRVILSEQPAGSCTSTNSSGSGDYINASHVDMRIPSPCGIVNRYIAAQGPLPNTCADFWQMCWEQTVSLVVMLTVSNERGRAKCHEYWPRLYETAEFEQCGLTVTSVSEQTVVLRGRQEADGLEDKDKVVRNQESEDLKSGKDSGSGGGDGSDNESGGSGVDCEDGGGSYVQREFMLSRVQQGEVEPGLQRQLTHLQFSDWPDHGTPSNTSDFLEFVSRVRAHRSGHLAPVVVHCSAGIGRTGVLITMETAACLLESGLPVRPLEIVRRMRDQRPMLIQTPSQYRFVCEAILMCWQRRRRRNPTVEESAEEEKEEEEEHGNGLNNCSGAC